MWVIDQVSGQDGWILVKFFFCVFLDRDGVEVHKRAKKTNLVPRVSHLTVFLELAPGDGKMRDPGNEEANIRRLDRTSLVNKGFIIWLSGNFSCGTQRVLQSEQDSSILPAGSAIFGSSCPLAELAI